MHSFPSWNEELFFRFNPRSVSKEFNIPLAETTESQAFVISKRQLHLGTKEWKKGNHFVYPVTFQDINSLIREIKYPAGKDFWKSSPSVRIRGNIGLLDFPEVMAIINMTPDSFYAGSRVSDDGVEERLDSIKKAGAKLVDIGGQSTRPGSEQVSVHEEMIRVKKAVEISLDKKFVVSIDSYRTEIIRECMEMGAHIINDVTGMENSEIGRLAKRYDVPLIIMHKKGNFKTMQLSPYYENVVQEIISFFLSKIEESRNIGIEDNIIFDPGIGFGKRVEDNVGILNNLRDFKLGRPLLIGLSRKNFIGEIMKETVDERGISSLIFNAIAVQNGADIIRVHDVEENVKLIKIIKKMKEI
jgi:dihydropteroate synthase